MNTTTQIAKTENETLEALKELFSPTEWKETFQHIHNDPEALRTLSVLGYGISFCLGALSGILLIAFAA